MKWRRGKKIKNNHVEKIEHKMQKERKKLCTKEMKQKREKKKEKKMCFVENHVAGTRQIMCVSGAM